MSLVFYFYKTPELPDDGQVSYEFGPNLKPLPTEIQEKTVPEKTESILKYKQTIFDKYWTAIADEMTLDFGCGHPETWDRATVEAFRTRMKERLIVLFKADDDLAKRYNVPTKQKEYEYEKFGVPAYASFWRLFIGKKEKSYRGNRTTRDLFALYFGAASFEDYIHQHGISGNEETSPREVTAITIPVTDEITSPTDHFSETVDLSASDKVPVKRTNRFWLLGSFGLGLLVLMLVFASSFTPSVHNPKEVLLVRTDGGLIILDPVTKKRVEVLQHGPITGLDYDPRSRMIFWSLFDGCPYCGISKAILNENFDGLEPGTTQLFITNEVNEPCGIALDPKRQLFYCANHGSGAISVYDYDGKMITPSLVPLSGGIPSSLDIDLKNQLLYWTDIENDRIGRINLRTLEHEPSYLGVVGCRPDGLSLDTVNNRLYWASSMSYEVGWADLNDAVPISRLFKTPEMPAAVEIDVLGEVLYYATENGDCVRNGMVQQDTLVLNRTTESILEAGNTRPGIIKQLKL